MIGFLFLLLAGCREPKDEMSARREAYHTRIVAVEAERKKAVDARKERKLRLLRRQRGY
jgi:hypothetical protein